MTLSICTVCSRHGDQLPEPSSARVSTWCEPSPVIWTTVPLGPCWMEPSASPTRHSTWSTSDTASVADTVKLTVRVVYQPRLAVVEVSVGGVVSPAIDTFTGMLRQPELLPAWSHTRVCSVWLPGPSIWAVALCTGVPLSTYHSTWSMPEPPSLPVTAICVWLATGPPGATVVSVGARPSILIVSVRETLLPATS